MDSVNIPIGIGHLDTGVSVKNPATQYIRSMVAVDRQGVVRSKDVNPQGEHGNFTASILLDTEFPELPELSLAVQLHSVCVPEGGKIILKLLAGMEALLDYPVQIVCMAMGIPQRTPIFADMLGKLRQKDMLLVSAVGNFGADNACAPGNYPHVLSVGAVNDDGRVPAFSGTYRDKQSGYIKPDVLALGVNMTATNSRGERKFCTGTSMATAYMTGLAARLKQLCPEVTADQLGHVLRVTSQPLMEDHQQYSAHGLVQPQAALDYLLTRDWESVDTKESLSEPAFLRQRYIDPRLRKQCDRAVLGQRIDALVMARPRSGDCPRHGTQALLEHVCQQVNVKLRHCRFFNHTDLVHIGADQDFYQQLLSHPDLMMGSAVDIDLAI